MSFFNQGNLHLNTYIIEPEERILVTGANGFIGSKVVQTLLEYGYKQIRCLTRLTSSSNRIDPLIQQYGNTRIQKIMGNLLSTATCEEITDGVSVIYHLAAGIEKSFAGCFLNSVVTTRNLVEASLKQKNLRRFVNISSIAVYTNDGIPRGGLMDESCTVDTRWMERFEPYTYGKAKQDELVLDYAEKYNLPLVIVRPSVVYGPGKAKITDRIGTNTFGLFLHLGLGNQIPLTYLDNCAEAIVLAGLKRGVEGQTFNIIDDDLPSSRNFLHGYKKNVQHFFSLPIPYPVWYLFNYLWEKYSIWSEGQLPPVFNRRSCAVYWQGNTYSNRKAKELLGWNPKVPTEEGLMNFFTYMKNKGTQ